MVRLCSICRNEGHDRRTCPLRINEPINESINESINELIRDNNHSICELLTNNLIYIINSVWNTFTGIIVILRTRTNNTIQSTNKDINRGPIPKHISNKIFDNEIDPLNCCICLSDIIKETFKISSCGHFYCTKCYYDNRLDKCAVCRKINF